MTPRTCPFCGATVSLPQWRYCTADCRNAARKAVRPLSRAEIARREARKAPRKCGCGRTYRLAPLGRAATCCGRCRLLRRSQVNAAYEAKRRAA